MPPERRLRHHSKKKQKKLATLSQAGTLVVDGDCAYLLTEEMVQDLGNMLVATNSASFGDETEPVLAPDDGSFNFLQGPWYAPLDPTDLVGSYFTLRKRGLEYLRVRLLSGDEVARNVLCGKYRRLAPYDPQRGPPNAYRDFGMREIGDVGQRVSWPTIKIDEGGMIKGIIKFSEF
jgi:hypothetical protein